MQLKLLSVAALVGAALAQTTQDLNQTLTNTPSLANLTLFLGQFPDLLKSLTEASNITVLAPSNEALAKLLSSEMEVELGKNPGLVQATLQYHVLNGTYYASNITNMTSFIPTMLTNTSFTNVTDGQRVAAAMVDDKVAFYSALLQNSTVTQANLNFTGGTIHIIDTVLTVPMSVSETAQAANLTSLAGALDAVQLVSTVEEKHDVTIFAPTNEGFQAIGSALENIADTDLSSILTYHVVEGTVGYSNTLANGTTLQTVNGANVTIHLQGDNIFVNSAKVVTANVLVANGVVHVIDNVLNPNNTSAAPGESATQGASAFEGASSVSQAPFTSGIPEPTSSIATTAGPPAAGKTSTSTAGAMPMKTGMVAPAVLFGGAAAVMMNL